MEKILVANIPEALLKKAMLYLLALIF